MDDTSSPQPVLENDKQAKSTLKDFTLKDSKIPKNKNLHTFQRRLSNEKNTTDKQDFNKEYEALFADDDGEEVGGKDDGKEEQQQPTPEAFKGLEPWLFQEFGDIVEIVGEWI